MNDGAYTLRDQYFSLRHYALFTDPGDVRIDAVSNRSQQLRATAFESPDHARVTAILLNVGSTELTVSLDGSSFGQASSEGYLTVFRPGESERWRELGSLGSAAELTLPSRAVATIVLRK